MIRKLMGSSAIAALVAAGAFSFAHAQAEQPAALEAPAVGAAETAAPAPAPPPAAAPAAGEVETTVAPEAPAADAAADTAAQDATPAPTGQTDETLTPDEPTIATAYIGQSVFSSQEPESDNIGEVNDLIIGSEGMITHAVVGVGGFLGIGEKNVAVPFDQLEVIEDDDGDIRLIYSATREQLEAAEAYDRTAYDPEARASEEQAAESNAAADNMAAVDAVDANDTAAEQADAVAEPALEPADAAIVETETTTAPAEGEQVAAVTTDVETAPAAVPGGFMSYSADQIRASTIIGQEIYGADNESIGEVSDLIMQEDGETRAALIDVGGFLGIGEKRVAIPFDQIEIVAAPVVDPVMDPALTDPAAPAVVTDPAAPAATVDPAAPAGSAEMVAADPAAPATAVPVDPTAPAAAIAAGLRLTVPMTREQLEALPEWEDAAERAAEAGAVEGAVVVETAPAAGTVDPAAPAAAEGEMAADADMQAAAPADQYQPVTEELSAAELMGSAVYGQNDENLGEVGDLVLDAQGAIQAVVVDVGGFLGMGEKPVALQYDAQNIQQNSAGDVRLIVNATQEQLEAAPSYNAALMGEAAQPTVQ